MSARPSRGFTLVEVLVALMVVSLALAALMSSVSSAARGSEYLRDKTIAQWIAMNRIVEARLKIQKFGESGDKGEVEFANRKWRFDTRYFETNNATIQQLVVRVWPSAAKAGAGPLAESASFLSQTLTPAGTYQADWTVVNTPQTGTPGGAGGRPTAPTHGSTPNTQ